MLWTRASSTRDGPSAASVDCLLMPAYATPSHEQLESTNRAGPL